MYNHIILNVGILYFSFFYLDAQGDAELYNIEP